eukprot:794327-Amphidinium_carterae.3
MVSPPSHPCSVSGNNETSPHNEVTSTDNSGFTLFAAGSSACAMGDRDKVPLCAKLGNGTGGVAAVAGICEVGALGGVALHRAGVVSAACVGSRSEPAIGAEGVIGSSSNSSCASSRGGRYCPARSAPGCREVSGEDPNHAGSVGNVHGRERGEAAQGSPAACVLPHEPMHLHSCLAAVDQGQDR